jgi:hypothetical protein
MSIFTLPDKLPLKSIFQFPGRLCAILTFCKWMERIAISSPSSKFMICMDIDNTIMKKHTPISSGVLVYNMICSLPNVQLIFVTARTEKMRKITEADLLTHDITKYNKLYMYPTSLPRSANDVAHFKMKCVEEYSTTYECNTLALIGDSWGDLVPSPSSLDFSPMDSINSYIIQNTQNTTTLLKLGSQR